MVGSIDSSPFGRLASTNIRQSSASEKQEQTSDSKEPTRVSVTGQLDIAASNNDAAKVSLSSLSSQSAPQESEDSSQSPIQESRQEARPQIERPERGGSELRRADEGREANRLAPPPRAENAEASGPPGAAAGLGAAPRADDAPGIQEIAQQNRAAADSTSNTPVTPENDPLAELQAQGGSVREVGPEQERPDVGRINIQA